MKGEQGSAAQKKDRVGMKAIFLIAFFGITSIACDRDPYASRLGNLANPPDLAGWCGPGDDSCPLAPDLAPPGKSCEAAKGLPGTRVFCLDFNAPSLDLTGWNLNDINSKRCGNGWSVSSGYLQVTNFSTLTDATCSLSLPSINMDSYSNVMISVLAAIDLNGTGGGSAAIWLGDPSDSNSKKVYSLSGKTSLGKTQVLSTVSRGDWPVPATGQNIFISQLSGTNPNTLGLRISSIAVLGIP